MLKFQKQAKSRDVHVIFKEQTRVPNAAFLQALAIALLLHLVGLAIFQVSPFKLGHVTTISPPVEVKIEYVSENDRTVLAELESNLNVIPSIPEPAASRLKIYANLKNRVARNIDYYKENEISTHPFENLKRTYSPETFITLKAKTTSVSGALHIHLFGELANRSYALQDVNNETYKGKAALFFIKVEDRTGKIFWYEPLYPLENKKQNKKTKKILEGIRFQKKPEGFISNGWIEIGMDA